MSVSVKLNNEQSHICFSKDMYVPKLSVPSCMDLECYSKEGHKELRGEHAKTAEVRVKRTRFSTAVTDLAHGKKANEGGRILT